MCPVTKANNCRIHLYLTKDNDDYNTGWIINIETKLNYPYSPL